jgi:hypothetical protein
MRMATAFDPTLTDPLDQLRRIVRAFLYYSAERPELLGLMNIEARQDTDRLAYLYDNFIAPTLEPVQRLLCYLSGEGRTVPISLATFLFLMAHGGAAPFTLRPLVRLFGEERMLQPTEIESHVDFVTDFIIRGLLADENPTAAAKPTTTSARTKK